MIGFVKIKRILKSTSVWANEGGLVEVIHKGEVYERRVYTSPNGRGTGGWVGAYVIINNKKYMLR